jgi:ATP10 protein
MGIARRLACIALVLGGVACAQTLRPGAALPQIIGTSLEGQEVTLPDVAAGKVTLLIITFSKAAGEKSQTWNDRFFKEYPQDDKVISYAIAMLEDVPSLLRGMVRGGIKRGIPASMRRRFLTVVKGEAEWKRYVDMQNDQDAYLILLDKKSRVQWIFHGQFEQTAYDAMKVKIAQMLSEKPS